jgi:RNA polymerase sigma-70 factor (ECF subfamily)
MITSDRDAIVATLYAEHGRAVIMFLSRYTNHDRLWAEDILQETMMRAWAHAAELDMTEPMVRSWLYTVASRIAIDDIRRRRVRPNEVALPALDPPLEDDAMEQALTEIVLHTALAQLSLAHRVVIIELYLHGSSVRDTAEKLGIPEGTVKSRAHHAMHSLRVKLAQPQGGRSMAAAAA